MIKNWKNRNFLSKKNRKINATLMDKDSLPTLMNYLNPSLWSINSDTCTSVHKPDSS